MKAFEKAIFEKPELSVVRFDNTDVICTSSQTNPAPQNTQVAVNFSDLDALN